MALTLTQNATNTATRSPRPPSVPPLENGAHLPAREFLRRYEAMPGVKKAELIDGIVYMASPVRTAQHAEPDNLIQGWLFTYAAATPGVRSATNATVRLGPDDTAQPDGLLRRLPECGGQARMDDEGYLHGGPELVVEIAASSVSMDTRQKRTAYRRAGVQEYLVWRTEDAALDWWKLEEDEYRPLPVGADGVIQSGVFPGLALDTAALLAGDGARLLAALHEGLRDPAHAAFVSELRERVTPPPAA